MNNKQEQLNEEFIKFLNGLSEGSRKQVQEINKTIDEFIKKGADIDTINRYGDTALMIAAEKGLTETTEMLIKNGANVDVVGKYGKTALMKAAINGHTETAEKLIKNKGCIEIVGTLIKNVADINAKDDYGWTALMYAVENGHTETAEMLVKNGANELSNKNQMADNSRQLGKDKNKDDGRSL